MSTSSSGRGKSNNNNEYMAAAADGMVALLSLAQESTDGVAVARGILGGLLWIVQTSRQFNNNKAEWKELAAYVSALRDDVESALVEYTDSAPPKTLVLDIKKLHQPLTTIAEEMERMAKRSRFSKILQTREDPQKIAGFRQSMTAAILKFNIVRLVSIERKLDTLVPAPQGEPNLNSVKPLARNQTSDVGPEAPSTKFGIQVAKENWPEFDPGDKSLESAGKLYYDFTDSWQKRWANGEETGGQFGRTVFPIQDTPPPQGELPTHLFDLWTNQVVKTSMIEGVVQGYTIVSHARGEEVLELDGSVYGVLWNIPIRRRAKLDQILQATRIIGGMRYVWMDILCLDQRPNQMREAEMSKMRSYYSNAAGCLVWLDNTHGENDWLQILSIIEDVNRLFNLDKSGKPTISVDEMMRDGLFKLSLDSKQALELVDKILTLEKAPWFSRVGTLQEAVIPEAIYFCTPERYMLCGAVLFHVIGMSAMIANTFTNMGEMTGVAILNQLQKSEVWKILRMRQLWTRGKLGYWPLVQGLRSRKTKDERDMMFGVLGLVKGSLDVDYNKGAGEFYRELWKDAVCRGEFGALCFLGDGDGRGVPDKDSVGLVPSASDDRANAVETHQLSICPNGVQLDNVGIDNVKSIYALVTSGALITWKSAEFLNLPVDAHIEIAKAWGVPPDLVHGICPGSMAAFSAMNPMPDNLLTVFGAEFREKYEQAVPKGLLTWMRIVTLLQASPDDNAVIVIWTVSSEPQLAVVTERPQGHVFVVTPSSYVDHPGEGCIVCQLTENGNIKKIGLGIGRRVKADRKVSVLLV